MPVELWHPSFSEVEGGHMEITLAMNYLHHIYVAR